MFTIGRRSSLFRVAVSGDASTTPRISGPSALMMARTPSLVTSFEYTVASVASRPSSTGWRAGSPVTPPRPSVLPHEKPGCVTRSCE
jgi:hypothetical protein